MENKALYNQPSSISTASGVIISIWQSIVLSEIVHTALCAAIGSAVSFLITLGLKHLFRKTRK